MKNIYTSNYARKGTDPNAISISCIPPKIYTGKWLRQLAPTWELVKSFKNKTINEQEYEKQYLQLLTERKLTPEKIINIIPNDAILLCYEPPGEFCHRRILAKWVEAHTGVIIPEWLNEREQKMQINNKIVDSLLDFK